jgi:hypothetical protein
MGFIAGAAEKNAAQHYCNNDPSGMQFGKETTVFIFHGHTFWV